MKKNKVILVTVCICMFTILISLFTHNLAKKKQAIRTKEAKSQNKTGFELLDKGNYENAIKTFNATSIKYKDIPLECVMAEYLIGMTYQRMGRREEAIKTWQNLVNKYPKARMAIFAKFLLGELPLEEFRIQVSLLELPDRYVSYTEYLIGFKFQMDGNLEEAKKYYKRCVELSGGEGISYHQAKKSIRENKQRLKE